MSMKNGPPPSRGWQRIEWMTMIIALGPQHTSLTTRFRAARLGYGEAEVVHNPELGLII